MGPQEPLAQQEPQVQPDQWGPLESLGIDGSAGLSIRFSKMITGSSMIQILTKFTNSALAEYQVGLRLLTYLVTWGQRVREVR
jgi:hypothetical protein